MGGIHKVSKHKTDNMRLGRNKHRRTTSMSLSRHPIEIKWSETDMYGGN